jgi:hypothetical protein
MKTVSKSFKNRNKLLAVATMRHSRKYSKARFFTFKCIKVPQKIVFLIFFIFLKGKQMFNTCENEWFILTVSGVF